MVGNTGRVEALGGAPSLSVASDWSSGHVAVAAAATATGQGLWVLAADGSVLAVGDAASFGPAAAATGKPDAVGIAATPDGGGYLVAFADGSVQAFGAAVSHGNATPPNGELHAIVAIALTPTGAGYWLVGADGQVYAFGDAASLGPAPAASGGDRVVAAASTPDGGGLWLATANGAILALGDAPPLAATGQSGPRLGVTASVAATPSGRGLWLASDGGSLGTRGDATAFAATADPSLGKLVAVVSAAPTGTLTVNVTDLPAGAAADVTATGAGAAFAVTGTDTLRVPAGDYAITAKPVDAGGITYHPTISGSPATVDPGASASATVDYFTAIPDTTKAIPAAAVEGATGDPATGETLMLDAAAAPTLAVGDIVAIGVTTATPYGLLGKVTAVSAAGGTLTVETTPASLEDAFARASFDAHWSPNGNTATSGPTAAQAGMHARNRTSSSFGTYPGQIPSSVCGAGASIALTGGISLTPDIEFGVGLGFPQIITSGFLKASLAESASLGLTASAAAQCSLSEPISPEWTDTIPFDIFGIPFVVSLQGDFELNADVNASGAVSTSVSQTMTVEAGATYDHGNITPVADKTTDFSFQPPSPTTSLDATVKVGPKATILIDDVAGPEFNLDAGLKLQADPSIQYPNDWWKLYGTLDAGFGFVIPHIFEWSNPDLIQYQQQLDQGVQPPLHPELSAKPNLVRPGDPITLTGAGFGANETVDLTLDDSQSLGTTSTDDTGAFKTTVTAPNTTNKTHTITATGTTSGASAKATIIIALIPKYQWVYQLRSIILGPTPFAAGWKIGSTADTKWFHLDGSSLGVNSQPPGTAYYVYGARSFRSDLSSLCDGLAQSLKPTCQIPPGLGPGWIASTRIPEDPAPGNRFVSGWTECNQPIHPPCGPNLLEEARAAWSRSLKIGTIYLFYDATNYGYTPDDLKGYVRVVTLAQMNRALRVDQPLQPYTGQPYSISTGWANPATGAGLTSLVLAYPSG